MAIRRKPPGPKPVEVRLGFLVLRFSDLTSLMELLTSRADGIKVIAGEKKITNLSDLYSASRSDRATLRIETSRPKMKIYLKGGEARIEATDATSPAIGLAEEIQAHLEPNRQKTPVAASALVLYMLLAIFIGAFAIFVSSIFTSPATAIIATGGLTLFTLWALLSLGRSMLSSGAVKLELGSRPRDVDKVQLREAVSLPEHITVFRLGFVRLYLDDLDDVLRTLSTHGKATYIKAGDADVDAAGDLRNATADELDDLYLGLRKPHVHVALRRQNASVYAMEATSKAISLADDIARLIGRRSTRFPVGHLYVLGSVAFSLGTLVSVPVIIWPDISTLERITAAGFAVLFPIMSVLLYTVARERGGTKIYKSDRAGRIDARRSWLQMWIGAVIGAVVSLGLTWWQLRA